MDLYSDIQCKSGFITFWILYCSHLSILCIIFLRRIKIVFKNSVYEYRPYIFRIFYTLIVFIFIAYLSMMVVRMEFDGKVIVLKDDGKYSDILPFNISLCTLHAVKTWSNVTMMIVGMIVAVIYLLINVSLSYMFLNGLYKLNKELINEFIANAITPSEDEQLMSLHDNQSMSRSIELVLDQYSRSNNSRHVKDSVKRIMDLYGLIKKQTILVVIAIVSSLSFSAATAIDHNLVVHFGWDLLIKGICVWLMLKVSDKYWNCCVKYGLCRCCYCNQNQFDL